VGYNSVADIMGLSSFI